jgi:ATP-binding cassette subfamily B multidrug efflux pump
VFFYRWLEGLIDVFAPFDNKTPPKGVLAFCWHFAAPVKGLLFVILFNSLLIASLESYLFVLIGWFTDMLASSTPQTLWADHGTKLTLLAVLILVIRPFLHFLDEALVNQGVLSTLTNRIRWQAHHHVIGHAVSYFQGDFAGRLANRVVQSGVAVRQVILQTINELWFVVIYAGTTVGVFAAASFWLAVPVALWLIAYGVLVAYFVPRAQAYSKDASNLRSAILGRVVDSYTNITTVKLFSRADQERSSVRDAIEEQTQVNFINMRLHTNVNGWLWVMNSSLLVATAAISAWLWSKGETTSGAVAAFLALVLRLSLMSGWVMRVVRDLFENIGTVQESIETISRPHDLVDKPNATKLSVTKGEISFDHVRFNYGKASGVFDDLSLTIRSGEKIGLIGRSGAGKSTFVSLLLRLHDVEGGHVLIDGQDIASVTQDSLREAIAVVSQDTSLLHRSIRDNIRYGRANASDAEIIAAAEAAEAHDFITQLQDMQGRTGYDSHVGERGVKLSGGQRQRIAIARVLLKNAPILVLDEATSALDSEVEAAIQAGLKPLMKGRTVIAIAHRLSTIAGLDRLIVMDKGRIVEEGTHAELLAAKGLYARLWARQSGGFLGQDVEAT